MARFLKSKVDEDVYRYFIEENLDKFLTEEEKKNIEYEYEYYDPNYAIIDASDPAADPLLLDLYDAVRLHKLIRSRKVSTVLEFGVGFSTFIMADAIFKNKIDYEKEENEIKLRSCNKFEIHSVDCDKKWIDFLENRLKNYLDIQNVIKIKHSKAKIGTFNNRICSFYEEIPDIIPDFIYLDAPSSHDVEGSINGLTFNKCHDRTIIAADILLMESTFVPGTFIIIDGRTNNVNFLKNNLQRKWNHYYSEQQDYSTLELIENPIGKWNKNKLKYSLNHVYLNNLSIIS